MFNISNGIIFGGDREPTSMTGDVTVCFYAYGSIVSCVKVAIFFRGCEIYGTVKIIRGRMDENIFGLNPPLECQTQTVLSVSAMRKEEKLRKSSQTELSPRI